MVLIAANILVWIVVWQKEPSKILKVSFLDVGQGDAIFIETPDKHQVLIDGGKNRKVVAELGRLMPFGDRSIDILISTHPDADHIGGLPEVVS
ncbi:MAG: MBL fold metallo-hydrolase, partial [Patescibacteria group bacterium]